MKLIWLPITLVLLDTDFRSVRAEETVTSTVAGQYAIIGNAERMCCGLNCEPGSIPNEVPTLRLL